MSIRDEAEALRAIASSEYLPIEMTRELQGCLLNINAAVMQILGDTPRAQEIAGYASAAADLFGQTIGVLQQLETAIHDAADYHGQG